MPIERATYTNTDSLQPHTISNSAKEAGVAHKYLPPGPGAYNDSKVDPSVTTKFKKTPGVTWGASKDSRFKADSTTDLASGVGPGSYSQQQLTIAAAAA